MQLAVIRATKVNMSVYLGNYPDAADTRQKGEVQTALLQYGGANMLCVTVSNEFILDSERTFISEVQTVWLNGLSVTLQRGKGRRIPTAPQDSKASSRFSLSLT